jgi:hypothetical protein
MSCGLAFGTAQGSWTPGRGVWEFVLGMIDEIYIDRKLAPIYAEWAQETLARFRYEYWPDKFPYVSNNYWDDYLIVDMRFHPLELMAIRDALQRLVVDMKAGRLPPMDGDVPYKSDEERYAEQASILLDMFGAYLAGPS